eukprot:4421160-Prymnesium_polylepis.1
MYLTGAVLRHHRPHRHCARRAVMNDDYDYDSPVPGQPYAHRQPGERTDVMMNDEMRLVSCDGRVPPHGSLAHSRTSQTCVLAAARRDTKGAGTQVWKNSRCERVGLSGWWCVGSCPPLLSYRCVACG